MSGFELLRAEALTLSVGLAPGSGAARGWAHLGVIRALGQAGIRPDLVCGTSIGALVGAAYAAGERVHWAGTLFNTPDPPV